LVAYLDEFPNKLNENFRYGWTPVHLAIHYNKLDILKYLLDEVEADPVHRDNDGATIFHHSFHVADTNFEFVKYLLESGKFKFLDDKDDHGNTPLHLAFNYLTLKQIEEIMPYFKGKKELFSERNNHGKTPLDLLKTRIKDDQSGAIVEALKKEIETEDAAADTPTSTRKGSKDNKAETHLRKATKSGIMGSQGNIHATKQNNSSSDEEKKVGSGSDEHKKKGKHHHHHEKKEKHSDDGHTEEKGTDHHEKKGSHHHHEKKSKEGDDEHKKEGKNGSKLKHSKHAHKDDEKKHD